MTYVVVSFSLVAWGGRCPKPDAGRPERRPRALTARGRATASRAAPASSAVLVDPTQLHEMVAATVREAVAVAGHPGPVATAVTPVQPAPLAQPSVAPVYLLSLYVQYRPAGSPQVRRRTPAQHRFIWSPSRQPFASRL